MICDLTSPVVLALLAAAPAHGAALLRGTDAPPSIRSVRIPKRTVPAWSLLEIEVELSARYTNPFDPDDVALEAEFITPSGRRERVPGFFYRGFVRSRRKDGTEVLTPAQTADWRIRYLPRTPGEYRCRIRLQDGETEVQAPQVEFRALPAAADGFVRVAKTNPRYFEFDSGKPYFAVGENVCWPGKGGTYDYDRYWKKLAANGANYARIWVGPFDCFTLERTARGTNDPAGLGRIDLAAAWRLDTVLQRAATEGIRIMFCIESFNSLRIRPMYARWKESPYNAANGGPLKKPEDFFTDPAARKLFMRRLRYIVARWAWTPAVLAWEFWNEVDIVETYRSREVAVWHRDMARYLRNIDPWDHLITTSFARTPGDPAVDGLPEMDYVQSHRYGAVDVAENVHNVCIEKSRKYEKPHYFGEFGTDWQAKNTRADTDGIHLHNGLWSAVASGAAGTSMLWWWDNYVDPQNLYYHFRPVADFVKGIPFNRVEYRPLKEARVDWDAPPPKQRPGTLFLTGKHATWTAAPWNKPSRFTVPRNGRVRDGERLTRLLHGTKNHADLHNPVTFDVDYPIPGEFVVRVTGVSGYGGANLRVEVDGKVALTRDFPDDEDGGKTLHKYDGFYAVPVPAGKHRITVSDEGRDWVFVEFRLRNFFVPDRPALRVYGLAAEAPVPDGPTVFLWLQNRANTWFRHNQGETPPPVPPTRVVLRDIPDGRYRLEWWDTYTGAVRRGGTATAAAGRLELRTPQISRDAAVKLLAVAAPGR
ncbi:MAG: DUF5060 domain-containing protein [Kiritimatiellaeota bacterium]|nr:DUF5060 domain-containing protein [Kiritimatiellota bacterium]